MRNEKTPVKKTSVLKSLGKYRTPFIIAILLLVISVIFTITAPSKLQNMTDLLQKGAQDIANGTGRMDLQAIAMAGLVILLFHIIAFAAGSISGILLNTAIQRY